jgi:hypothetical protein
MTVGELCGIPRYIYNNITLSGRHNITRGREKKRGLLVGSMGH